MWRTPGGALVRSENVASQKARDVENTPVFRAKARDFSTCTGHVFDVATIVNIVGSTSWEKHNMSNAKLQTILRQHAIPVDCWPAMKALVLDGVRPSRELVRRLNHVGNYMAALQSILIALSAQVKHKFPPTLASRKAS